MSRWPRTEVDLDGEALAQDGGRAVLAVEAFVQRHEAEAGRRASGRTVALAGGLA